LEYSEYYMNLKADVSGSRAKNRFRLELLWGIGKMLELMESNDDFTVVFDYVCDIEVHKDSSLDFYQIKSHKANQSKYTVRNLTSYKEGQEGSIIGKLYALNMQNNKDIKLVLVCNTPSTLFDDEFGEKSFSLITEDNKKKLIRAIEEELKVEDVDISNIFYLYTHMNLANPEDEIKGKLISSFEKIKGNEPVKPNALYRLILETVTEKACYEFLAEDYDELVKLKGVTREEFDRMLTAYETNEKTGVETTIKYIQSLDNLQERRIYSRALGSLLPKMAKSRELGDMEIDMAHTLKNHNITSFDEAIDLLTEKYHPMFSIEYDNAEKTACYMLVINKYSEGGYNEINL